MTSESTAKARILDAAENLFATNGFSGTSLRSIIKAADVNTAAIHYYFGSKDGLIAAVLTRCAGPVNSERLRKLDGIEASHAGGSLPLEGVIEAFIEPAIRTHLDPSGGVSNLPRLMGRAISEPDQTVRATLHRTFEEVSKRFVAALTRALPELPREEVLWKMHFMIGAMAFTLAVPKSHVDTGQRESTRREHVHIARRLLTFVAAGMRARVVESLGGKEC